MSLALELGGVGTGLGIDESQVLTYALPLTVSGTQEQMPPVSLLPELNRI